MPPPDLSKSRYLSGLQCDLRLWLDVHDPDSASPLSDATRHIFEMGTEVGRAARALIPNGVLVKARASEHAEAVARTRDLMSDESIPAIFEAAFEHADVRIRVDILERRAGGRWGLREVKSSSRVKRDQHLPDLAVQKWVLDGCGLEVDSAELIHVNGRFVRGEGEIEWASYFKRVELLDELDGAAMADVATRVASMSRIVAEMQRPVREPGPFCKKPHLCRYWEACTASKSAGWKISQTGAKHEKKEQMIEAAESGVLWVSAGLGKALPVAAPPVWALDFETIGPAIPFYPGTRPYEAIAFQWSLHRLAEDGDGELEHFEFLADGAVDPRSEVARTLVETLGCDSAPILAYGSYEKTCLGNLATSVPNLASELRSIEKRVVDLHKIVKAHVYHPGFLGSFSLKKVGPALAPHAGYSDLEGVAEGTAAMGAFARIVRGEVAGDELERERSGLLDYCGRDTLALMEAYRALRRGLSSPPKIGRP